MKNCYKYLLVFSILLLTAMSNRANAQIIKGEVFGGASISQVDGDECFGYDRFKGQLGVGALIPVTNWMDIGLELVYNPKGALRKDTLDASSGTFNGIYDLKLNYAEIPLMVYVTDKETYTLGLGASFGRLIGLSEKVNGVETDVTLGNGYLRWKNGYNGGDLSYISTNEDLSNPIFYDDSTGMFLLQNSNTFKKNDFSVCADLRIRVWEGLHVQLRYQYSLVPIRTRLFTDYDPYERYHVRLQYNNQISLRLTYIFNERRSSMNREFQQKERRR